MLRSVSLLKIYHTEGPHTLGEMVSHTGDPHIPVIMVCHTDGPHPPGKKVSHKGGPYFHKGIPIFPGKWGPRVHILPVIWVLSWLGTQIPSFLGKWGPGVSILRGSPFSHDTRPLFFGPHVQNNMVRVPILRCEHAL